MTNRPQIRTLLVEDSPTDGLLLQEALTDAPHAEFAMTHVEKLGEALARLGEERFDVVLLDLGLPDSQGTDTLIRLRQYQPEVPVVVLTGLDDEAVGIRSMQLGAQDYLVKGDFQQILLERSIRYAIERHYNALALRQSQARLWGLVDSAMDAIITVDDKQRIVLFNPAAEQMFGCAATEALGQTVDRFIPERLRSTHADHVRVFDQTNVTRRRMGELGVIHGLRADGTEFPIEASISQVELAGERLLTVILRDITERQQVEEIQRRTEKLAALGVLAGGIAHDFNNILMAINGNATLAVAELAPHHPAQESLAEIAKAGARAAQLVQRILAFSRPQDLQPTVVQLQRVVDEALNLLRTTLPATIEIRTEFTTNLPAVGVDSGQVHEVIVNLAVNAVHAIGRRAGFIEFALGEVTVKGETEIPNLGKGRYVRLSVRDNGCGMDRDTLSHIFEPFFTTKEPGHGTGLGLPVVHGIMKSHGGGVTVESGPGKGATFRLYFPAVEDVVEPVPVKPREIHLDRSEHILYVDDEAALVLLVKRVLERLGYKFTGHSDPIEALEAFRSQPEDFDVVVTDLTMPRMSGFELASAMLEARPDLRIIIISGYVRPEDRERARSIGIRDMIEKPNSVNQLGEALDALFHATPPT